ncbi:MAG: HEAT repeat domain-containing protein [Planctomycetota bacterium]|jgi:HEAT repeat protein
MHNFRYPTLKSYTSPALLLLLLQLPIICGCSFLNARFQDFTDIIIFEYHTGIGGGIHVDATQFLGSTIGYGRTKHTSCRLRDGLTYLDEMAFAGFGVYGFIADETLERLCHFEEEKGHTLETGLYLGPINIVGWRMPPHRWGDVSVFTLVGIFGFRIGLSPGETLDFVLGWTTLDIAEDDHRESKEDDHDKDIEIIINSKDVDMRVQAAENLAFSRHRDAVKMLIMALRNDSDPAVRKKSAESLGKTNVIRVSNVVSGLAQALLTDPDSEVRSTCARALGNRRNKDATRFLLEALKIEVDSNSRVQIINALNFIADKSAYPALLNIASKDSNTNVRAAAITSLGSIGDKDVYTTLIDALENNNEDIRLAALFAMFELQLRSITDNRVVEPLMNTAKYDTSEFAQIRAIIALGQLCDNRAIETLIHICENDKKEKVRIMAIGELGNSGGVLGIQSLKKLIETESDLEIITAARKALRKLNK